MLEPDVTDSVEEDEEGLNELGAWDASFPAWHEIDAGLNIPSPSKVRESPHPATKRIETVPEEDTTLNPMGKAIEDGIAALYQSRVSRDVYGSNQGNLQRYH